MPSRATVVLLHVFLGGIPSVYGQAGPDPYLSKAQSAADNMVRMHQAWGPKASTKGASLSIEESSRSGQRIKFRLVAKGLPNDTVYTLLTWPVTQKGPSEALKGITLDAAGTAICTGTLGTCGSAEKPNDPIDLVVQPLSGEPVRFGLVSADGATRVFATVVPIPLRGEDRGCRMEAILLTPGAELVVIEGSGFSPNSDLQMNSVSEGERHGGKGKTDANGKYSSAILPYKQGVSQGMTKVDLKATECAPSVEFRWGRRN